MDAFTPRPLATKPGYSRGQPSSKARKELSINPDQEINAFSFPTVVKDVAIQHNAIRSRLLYRSLIRDQSFLLHLKRLWEKKLDKLKLERSILKQMCEYKGEDVEQVPALFESAKQVETSTYALQQLEEGASALPTTATLTGASSETPSTTRSPLLEPMTKRARMDKDSIETIRARDQPDTASETSQADDQESDVSDTLESQVADDEMLDTLNDDGDEDPEDDETARQALTYMLQHFGPDL